MEVIRYEDPAAFRRDAAPVLLADPAANNLPLGILQLLLDQPEVYPSFHLWIARRDGRPQGAALKTGLHNVVLAQPIHDDAVGALAEAAVRDLGSLPGVVANIPWVEAFARRVTALTGLEARRILREGVWELRTVRDVPAPGGAARAATPDDRELVRRWIGAFLEEALPTDQPRDDAAMERQLDFRLAGEGGGYWLWEDEEPVSLSGHHYAAVGSRIGPVYTPPLHRRRGYAARLVAELSAARLAQGDAACFLFTDMANPTSNALYARIGYVKVCEAAEYAFLPSDGGAT